MAAKTPPTELEQVTAVRDALRDHLGRLSAEHARLSDNHMRILAKAAEWERRARAAYLADAQAQTARYATYAAAGAEVDPTYLVGLVRALGDKPSREDLRAAVASALAVEQAWKDRARIDAEQVAEQAREALRAAHADLVEAWRAAGGTDFDDVAAARS